MSVPETVSPGGKAPRAARMRADERRQRLIEVAVSVFAREGYERTSLAKICATAGIGRGTLYEYFDSKRDLFREVLTEHAKELLSNMMPFYRQPLDGTSADEAVDRASIRERVTARFATIFRHFRDNRDIYTIFLREAMAKNAETEDLFRMIRDQQLAMVADELADAMNRGLAKRHSDPKRLAAFLLGGVMHVAFRDLIDTNEDVDIDALAALTADMALAGL